jgi:non-heme chloroperoxidase
MAEGAILGESAMQTHTVQGGGGLKLHVREWGKPERPAILFIHGWSQHHLCWGGQIESPLANDYRLVALDIRGHGQSEAPLAADNYTRGELWADDINNVIDGLNLRNPLLVGWSYGGFIIGDYLRKNGDAAIAGVNFVCAAIGIGPRWFGDYIGPGFLDHAPLACSDDQAVALKAIRDFLHVAVKKPVAAEALEFAMGWNMLVHPQVRAHLINREEDFTSDLAKLKKPALVTYGGADTVILPAMAKMITSSAPRCETSEYDGVGHAPFLEEPIRFNKELSAFARRAFG